MVRFIPEKRERRKIRKLFKKILFPTDGSEFSQKAAAFVIEIARKFDAGVTVLHVIHKPRATKIGISTGVSGGTATGEFSAVVLPESSEEEGREKKTGQTLLGQAKHVFQKAGIHIETLLKYGQAGNVICEIADEGEFGLIIMNSKGHGKIKAFVMGSISYHVSRNAKCPVLIIR